MTHRLRLLPALSAATALAGALLIAGGCGLGGQPPASVHSAAVQAAGSRGAAAGAASVGSKHAPGCSAVPASMVNSVLGTSVGDPVMTAGDEYGHTSTLCSYSAAGDIEPSVHIHFFTGETPDAFQASKRGFTQGEFKATVQDLPGIGDSAYTATMTAGRAQTNTLMVLQGTSFISIISNASIPKEEDLARKLLPLL